MTSAVACRNVVDTPSCRTVAAALPPPRYYVPVGAKHMLPPPSFDVNGRETTGYWEEITTPEDFSSGNLVFVARVRHHSINCFPTMVERVHPRII